MDNNKPQDKAAPQTPAAAMNNNAVITWFDADGKECGTDTVPRSTAELMKFIVTKLDANPDLGVERKILITITATPNQPKNPDGSDQKIEIAGTIKEAVGKLQAITVSPTTVLAEFQKMCIFFSDRSALKGILITAVFDDAAAGGFGFLSTTSTLTDPDIVTLVEATKNQVDLFADKIKVTHPDIKFKETSLIFLPNGTKA